MRPCVNCARSKQVEKAGRVSLGLFFARCGKPHSCTRLGRALPISRPGSVSLCLRAERADSQSAIGEIKRQLHRAPPGGRDTPREPSRARFRRAKSKPANIGAVPATQRRGALKLSRSHSGKLAALRSLWLHRSHSRSGSAGAHSPLNAIYCTPQTLRLFPVASIGRQGNSRSCPRRCFGRKNAGSECCRF